MSTYTPTIDEGATLAVTVRALALDAHRLTTDPDPDPEAVLALMRRIVQVRRQWCADRSSDLCRWLANLQRGLDRLPRAEASRLEPVAAL
jgi:hypothetical protein